MLGDQHRCNHMKNMKIIFNENSYLIVIFEILLPKWQKDVKIENEKFSEFILVKMVKNSSVFYSMVTYSSVRSNKFQAISLK